MKKVFPIVLISFVFFGVLATQMFIDLMPSRAGMSSESKARMAHYTNEFKDLVLSDHNNKDITTLKKNAEIVILNFWASWCQPCLVEFPSLNALAQDYDEKKLLVIGINNEEENQMANLKRIVANYKLAFPNVADRNNEVLDKFKISSLPSSIIFVNGIAYKVKEGGFDFQDEDFLDEINSILKKTK